MKAKQLAELLEVIVRKVVREELKPIITEIKRASKPLIKETKSKSKTVKDPLDIDLSEILKEEKVSTPSKPKTFVKNPMLNEMLNQTMNDGEWRTLDSQFGYNQAQRWVDNGSTSVAPTTDIDGKPIDTNNEQVAAAVGAMTKDYSQLMKAIEKKKGR
jgi:hypothetical protein